ncbi:thioredoxin fold domain-containing protein [Trinickia acidisoli]|uniref:thioredoxin fold domain-containing protein n=1 Tax=Trinickia acidisoli TaxID=2767482 RepID=UPI001A8C5031|nr:thioredoxin fold domain-containing protein [Trinickia acidisoli]
MRLKFERGDARARDVVLIEADGTVYTSFAKTGYLRAAARTRFACGTAAATGAFSISRGQMQPAEAAEAPEQGQANHGLVFISEIEGEEKIALIERFAREEDAERALAMIETALRRSAVAQRRFRIWRSLMLWVGAPFLMFMATMSVVQFLNSHNAALDDLNKLARLAQDNPSAFGFPAVSPQAAAAANSAAIQAARAASAPTSEPSFSPVPTVASATANTANTAASAPIATMQAKARAMASIHFGLDDQTPKKTLYVYSDPNCPACRRFEAHINDLARDFSIYVLPVAYQEGSAKIASQILCASDRKQKWMMTMSRAKTSDPVAGDDCENGYGGLKANMDTFESLGFDSTPRVVGGDGTVFAAGATANAIRIQAAAR